MSEKKTAHVSGRVAFIRYSKDDTLIGELLTYGDEDQPAERTKFKGFMPQVFQGDAVTLHGTWYDHPKFGLQVDVEWFEFDKESECDSEQLQVADACKFLFVELELKKRGQIIFRAFRGESRAVLNADPYAAAEIPQIGFSTAEKIAGLLNIGPYDIRRIDAKVSEILRKAADDKGHHYVMWSQLVEFAASSLEVDYEVVQDSIDRLTRPRQGHFKDRPPEIALETDESDNTTIAYPYYLRIAECRLAERVARFQNTPPQPLNFREEDLATLKKRIFKFVETDSESYEEVVEDDTEPEIIELSEDQREAVKLGLTSTFSIITGGPGVGKTTIVKKLVEICEKNNLNIDLCSFTGRAARRLRETTGRGAYTIHKLLGYDPRRGVFQLGPKAPLESDIIICDETSMVNLYMGYKLLDAVKEGARVILVGDADQLPPIGAGAIFRELIDSGLVPVARLEKIFRQGEKSRIIRESKALIEKRMPENGDLEERDDFYIFTSANQSRALNTLLDLVKNRIPIQFGVDPFDIQILAPVYKGDVGINRLNEELQVLLQGKSPPEGQRFLKGDKVMFTKNDHDLGVMNGDVGRVISVGKTIRVSIDGVPYSFDSSQQMHLQLAYAVSIHKSQGSEYPAVITIVTPGGPPGFFNRNMLYTAITRGKQLSIIMSVPGRVPLENVVKTGLRKRNSRLIERITKCIELGDEVVPTEDTWDLETQKEVLS